MTSSSAPVPNSEREAHLVVCAFWTTEPYDDATAQAASAMDGHAIKGSGAAVSLRGVDAPLRRWLRAIQLGEAADFDPDALSTTRAEGNDLPPGYGEGCSEASAIGQMAIDRQRRGAETEEERG